MENVKLPTGLYTLRTLRATLGAGPPAQQADLRGEVLVAAAQAHRLTGRTPAAAGLLVEAARHLAGLAANGAPEPASLPAGRDTLGRPLPPWLPAAGAWPPGSSGCSPPTIRARTTAAPSARYQPAPCAAT